MTQPSLKVASSAFLLTSFHLIMAFEKRNRSLPQYMISFFTGKQRIAHKPNSKPKMDVVFDLKEQDEEDEGKSGDTGSRKGIISEEELWARLDELERLEELQDEQDRYRLSLGSKCSMIKKGTFWLF